jgi:UDP-N-acetylmuramate-alanine ligase
VDAAKAKGHAHAYYVDKKEDIPALLAPLLAGGDAVVVMGAGDINEICNDILARIGNA